MSKDGKCFFFFFWVLISLVGCQMEDQKFPLNEFEEYKSHPRLLLLEGEEQDITDVIKSEGTWQKMHAAIMEASNKILGQPPIERELTGRRLLSKSRECLRRVFYLAYAFRMSEDDRFLKRAEEEMLAVAGFSNWNPSHMMGPSGKSFNWSDCGVNTNLNPAMFWFAERNNHPSLLWGENRFLKDENYSHNVLTIDDKHQRVDGYAKIDRHSDAGDFPFAISDITSVYEGQLKQATRGVGIKDEQFVVVRDELETLDKTTEIRWKMLTHANVETGNKEAT